MFTLLCELSLSSQDIITCRRGVGRHFFQFLGRKYTSCLECSINKCILLLTNIENTVMFYCKVEYNKDMTEISLNIGTF